MYRPKQIKYITKKIMKILAIVFLKEDSVGA